MSIFQIANPYFSWQHNPSASMCCHISEHLPKPRQLTTMYVGDVLSYRKS